MRFFLLKLGECSLIMTLLSFFYYRIEKKYLGRVQARTRFLVWVAGMIGFLLPIKPLPFPGVFDLLSASSAGTGMAETAERLLAQPAGRVWGIVLFGLWAFGAWIFLVVRLNRHFVWMNQVRRLSRELSDRDMLACLNREMREMKIRRPIGARVSSVLSTPMITGIRRPLLLLPEQAYEPETFRLIVKHELCHYKRGDLWFRMLSLAASALHWFNPFMKIFNRRAEEVCELACDERAVASEDWAGRRCYCQALLKTARKQAEVRTTCTSAFFSGKENLKDRMEAVLNREKKRKSPLVLTMAVVLIAASGLLFGSQNRFSRERGQAGAERIEATTFVATAAETRLP